MKEHLQPFWFDYSNFKQRIKFNVKLLNHCTLSAILSTEDICSISELSPAEFVAAGALVSMLSKLPIAASGCRFFKILPPVKPVRITH